MGFCAVGASPASLGSMQIIFPAAPSGQKQRYSHLLRIDASSSQCSGKNSSEFRDGPPVESFGCVGPDSQ
eukprot:15381836-Heterocapsa_arctica.AAC.1